MIPALDQNNNPLDPSKHTRAMLLEMIEKEPYTTAAQYQQNPIPAGGGIYKKDAFVYYDYLQPCQLTFLTIDTAETEKSYNDATVFSFWGLHQVKQFGANTDIYGLQWLDCLEVRIEPKDLEHTFNQFMMECYRHPVKPFVVAIEKKSTGVTLSSVLKTYPGLRIIDLTPSIKTGSKIDRFVSIQGHIYRGLISFAKGALHAEKCIEHCSKITANNSHRHDDIADTLYYAVKLALIDKALDAYLSVGKKDDTLSYLKQHTQNLNNLRKETKW